MFGESKINRLSLHPLFESSVLRKIETRLEKLNIYEHYVEKDIVARR